LQNKELSKMEESLREDVVKLRKTEGPKKFEIVKKIGETLFRYRHKLHVYNKTEQQRAVKCVRPVQKTIRENPHQATTRKP